MENKVFKCRVSDRLTIGGTNGPSYVPSRGTNISVD